MTRIHNIRTITKFRRSAKAISPVIATLLMIAIAVVASLVVYAWVSGYIGFQTNNAGQAIQIQSSAPGDNSDETKIYVQNIGQGDVKVGAVFINDAKVDITSAILDISKGKTITLIVDSPWSSSDTIKVTTTGGTFSEIKGTSGSGKSSPSHPALSISIDGSGTVTKVPDQATYSIGESVELTANAAAGWTFAGWTGDLTISDIKGTLIIDSNPQVTATFTQLEYSLTVTANPLEGGSITLNNNGPYHYGDTVEMTPTPNDHYTFSAWDGDLTGTNNPGQITITGNMIVTADFTADTVTLTIIQATGGTITADPSTGPYHYGDSVQFTATSDQSHSFTEWTEDLSGSTNPYTVELTGHTTVSATYTSNGPLDHFTITDPNGGDIQNQKKNVAFDIKITVYDANGNVITNYAGAATLSDPLNTITPTATSGGWVNGVWSHTVTITEKYTSGDGDIITVTDGAVNAQSNSFKVNN